MKILDTKEYLDLVCSQLRCGAGPISVPVKGTSMRPFLRDGDIVFLSPVNTAPKPGDILLYQRQNGQYVLHRVRKLLPGGKLLMQGDSQFVPEEIAPEQLRGTVILVRTDSGDSDRGSIKWWFFAQVWRWLTPVRKYIYKIYGWFKRIFKKPGR